MTHGIYDNNKLMNEVFTAIDYNPRMNVGSGGEFGLFFNNKAVHVITDHKGEPWFEWSGLLELLELLTKKTAVEYGIVNYKIKKLHELMTPSLRGGHSVHKNANYNKLYVSESAMYSLVFRSNKPAAIAFTEWVTEEVLPTIRKTGAYITERATTTDVLEQLTPKQRYRIGMAFINNYCNNPEQASTSASYNFCHDNCISINELVGD